MFHVKHSTPLVLILRLSLLLLSVEIFIDMRLMFRISECIMR